ncbi:HAD-IIB family hydrolase [Salipiger marinus]|uniref:Mannosyl-3-phosphoglycerate phosphatase n=1 Tax=Salipiger marinus TaxID=555512 RepID=A0A1G8JJX8_9RHOB|nr:HAD-IIB family hydrolase [Salipiger marinus]SDI31609.1 mannosyl-3-phosphoglycerate phosphatase [Salipiger marinus]
MRLVVFTDLDGTLLDHGSYRYDAAAPALATLRRHNIPLILASSKTAAEIAPLHAALGLGHWPALVENGAQRMVPGQPPACDDYPRLRAALNALPRELRAGFRGFGDMDAAEVTALTGLPPEDAARARDRRFSEPGLWSGTESQLARFLQALAAQGLQARQGGRFLTLSHGGTKADQMAAIMSDLGAEQSLALGDAPNDAEMLQTATRGVILPNPHGRPVPPLPGEVTGHITRSTLPGPEGWNAAVLAHLSDLGFPET